ncbi:OLC1v1028793C1 [Oldenlandia corymbosa var. corymbosa]|uniref:Protein SDA1 n=1 Tax=Oldenlandia corymbosa var. corymbosa TaxID=529605 RepID=A0AAV1CD04_OLDCO|nr:OLC1v1028793C1 [Oldenlandia corymbosa var. corymbosa]
MAPEASSSLPDLNPEAILASGRDAEKLSLPALQSKMKSDPEGYEMELQLIYSQFKSSMELFKDQAAMSFTSASGIAADPTVAKNLGDRAMFLAHVAPFYPKMKQMSEFPGELAEFLRASARTLPSGLRVHVTQALILLINRKMVDTEKILELFMELQTFGDKTLRTLAFSHVVHSIRKMNQKHKNDKKNRALQSILFSMLQQEDETKARRSLITLCELHRRKVWFDDRTANAICNACFHPSTRIMVAALSFLLDYEKIENGSDSDDADSEEELEAQQPQIVVSKEAIYKAQHKGTSASKKKKKAKLQRVIRSMKKQQRSSAQKNVSSYYSPLKHLKDPQGFAEKLFSRLLTKTGSERFEVKMMLLKVITRVVGLYSLIIENLYPFLQKYVQPHQRDVTSLLAAAVQACHDMVPPDFVQPLFKQIVNQFVHDKSRTEAISVGLNVVREICLRMPLLMTEDLLQDLVLYKKSNEKAVSSAARSLVTLFREVCPSLLLKKDRGRPIHPKAAPKAYGEVTVATNVPGVELLEDDNGSIDSDTDDELISSSDREEDVVSESDCDGSDNDDGGILSKGSSSEDDFMLEEDDSEDDANISYESADATSEDNDQNGESDEDDEHEASGSLSSVRGDDANHERRPKFGKRKLSDFDEELNAANKSLRALKKLAGTRTNDTADADDGILSNEDFQRIKELKAKKEARVALNAHGFKLPSSDQLSLKRVDAAKLEANIRRKMTKDERLELVRAGREDRGKYQARAAIKKKKTGGLTNKQKEHKKALPRAAKMAKVSRSKQEKKRKQQRSGKQFRGRKAWK